MTHQTFPKPTPRKPKSRRPIGRSAKGLAYDDEYHRVAEKVMERAKGMCECGCGRQGDTAHHRKRRSQRGPNTMANLVWISDECHAWVHSHPKASYANGLLIRRNDPITPYKPAPSDFRQGRSSATPCADDGVAAGPADLVHTEVAGLARLPLMTMRDAEKWGDAEGYPFLGVLHIDRFARRLPSLGAGAGRTRNVVSDTSRSGTIEK